jgi:hypothetical protein
MTPEELLKPRIKVTAPYPFMPCKVGEQLEQVNDSFKYAKVGNVAHVDSLEFIGQYPHLFKKLEWWEQRRS